MLNNVTAVVKELIDECLSAAFHLLKAEKELENKRRRLEEWLTSTFFMKRVPTDEIYPSYCASYGEVEHDTSDDNTHGIFDPYVYVRGEDVKSIEGKTDKRGSPFGKCLVTLRNGDELLGSWREGRREGLGNTSGPSLEARGINIIQGYYTRGYLQGRGRVKMMDGCQFECDFVDSRAEGWVVSVFTRTLGDLDTDTAREEHVVTGPFVARLAENIKKKTEKNMQNI